MSNLPVVRIQCAAITRGCVSALMTEVHDGLVLARLRNLLRSKPISELGEGDLPAEVLTNLRVNGWRLDHGRWVCGLPHDLAAPDARTRRHQAALIRKRARRP